MARRQLVNQPLPTNSFTPAVFQGVTFEPTTEQPEILQRSLAQQDANANNAFDTDTKMRELFRDEKTKLHNDEATMKWWQDKEDEIINNYNARLNAGAYGDAVRYLQSARQELTANAELLGKQKRNAQYQQIRTDIENNKNISTTKREYLLNNFKYTEDPIIGDDGSIIGQRDLEKPIIYDSPDYIKIWSTASQLNRPDSITSSSSVKNSGEREGSGTGLTGNPVEHYSTERGSSHSKTQVSDEDVWETVQKMYDSNTDLRNSINQEFDADLWYYNNKIKPKLDTPEGANDEWLQEENARMVKKLFNGAGKADPKVYILYQLKTKGYAKEVSYINKNDSSKKEDVVTPGRGGNGTMYDKYGREIKQASPLNSNVPGAKVMMKNKTLTPPPNQTDADKIGKRFRNSEQGKEDDNPYSYRNFTGGLIK